MKRIIFNVLVFGLLLFGCKQTENKTTATIEEIKKTSTDDLAQIQDLIRQVLNWANSKNSFDLVPILADDNDSIYIGFDLDEHERNLNKLQQVNLFAKEFIENYNQIILTLDNGIKNGNYDKWLVGEFPTFIFANGADPWTLCQDVPYDKPNPYNFIEVTLTNAEKGEAEWKWGKLELNTNKIWKDFTYKFRVVKVNGKWQIAYLAGFDFKESTRKDKY